jgi:CRP-like cAMP-binding protein
MDPHSTVHKILNAYSPVDLFGAQLLLDHGDIETFSKDDIVFHVNRFNAFEYFQLEGTSHRFNTAEDKEQVTTGIYHGETVITPHMARTPNGQSIFSLQALTACTYLMVPAGKFRELIDSNQQIRMFGRAVIEKEYAWSLRFEVLFRSSTARDRLLYFRDNYPGLENLIPHTIIASFLGITPVSFSRLRSDLTRR